MKNKFTHASVKFLLGAAVGTFVWMAASAVSPGVKVNHLGTDHTLVRVDSTARYLMMPVQENNSDARITVLADGRPVDKMYVRLARNKVDYSVPFDLTPYKGKHLILDITSDNDRSNLRDASEEICWNRFQVTDSINLTNTEKYRPAFHHTPLYGWMNDPNGMFYKDGRWHLYYQYNPYGSKWQNMSWGHSSSPDLINWEHHPVALRPDGLGDIFSGSCIIDSDNTAGFGEDAVVAMFTSAGKSQMQSLAVSHDDGETFEMYPANPVLTLETEARDPNLFLNKETGLWTLILAHALEKEMLIFTSPDLKEWTLSDAFGKGLGAQDGVWECPDLIELPVDGGDMTKWILICNLNPGGPFGGSGIQYFTGEFDGKKFIADTLEDGSVATKWLDYGKDNYALVSWHNAPDMRHEVIGWMSNWQYAAEVPTKQFRSANTLPRSLKLFTGRDGQVYASNAPSPEVAELRLDKVVSSKQISVGSGMKTWKLPVQNNGICEINLSLKTKEAESVEFLLANAAGEKVSMTYNPADATLSFDRTQSGITDFSGEFPAVTVAPLHGNKGELSLRIFVDTSSIELFADEGRSVMTNLVFPTTPYSTFSVSSRGGKSEITDLNIFSLKPVSL